jgi:polysaccharide biosynthesis transport protein
VNMSKESGTPPVLEQVLQIISRRRRVVLLAFLIPFTGVVTFALFVPKLYRSTAVVVVERSTGVTDDDVDTRLSTLKRENLSRSRLSALIDRFDLYRNIKGLTSREFLIDQMQKDIRIDIDTEEYGGRNVAVAVHVTYIARDPGVAANVANDLAAFYEREDLRMREQRAGYTRSKLQEQLTEARQRLDEQEKRVKDYKKSHLDELPEQVGLHLSALTQINSQIRSEQGASERRSSAVEPKHESIAEPKRDPTVEPKHDERLDRLHELETRYTAEYPDVKRLKREIALMPYPNLPFDDAPPSVTIPATPYDTDTKASVKDTHRGVERRGVERRGVEQLRQTAAVHAERILNAPFRQQELDALLPDYMAARSAYQSLWDKYEVAQLWDPRHDGGALRVLDPAAPRKDAVAPDVARMVAMGVALSLVVIIVAVAIVERMDTSFHTLADLRMFTRVPVLASVPRLVTRNDRRRDRQKIRRFTAIVLLLVGLVFVGSVYVSHSDQGFVSWMSKSRP